MLKLLFFVLLGLILVCGIIIIAILDVEIKKHDVRIKDIQTHQDHFRMKNTALDEEFTALSEFVHMWTDPGVAVESYYAHLPQIRNSLERMDEILSEMDDLGDEMQTYLESLREGREGDE